MMKKNDKDYNSEDNLKKMMESATDSSGLDNGVDNSKPEGKSTKKAVVFTVIGLLLFGALLVTAALLLKDDSEFVDKTETPDWVGKGGNDEEVEDDYDYWDFEHPIELRDWAKEPFVTDEFWAQEGIEDVILEASKEMQSFYSTVAWMKSGLPHPYEDEELAGPYTNDISQRYLEDGSENPDFSYALSEDYQKAYVTYTERLLNPVFGGWSAVQSQNSSIKNDGTYNELKDMFSSSWWSENVKKFEDYSNLPIFAEWETGSWEGYGLAERDGYKYGVFYGVIKETEDKYVTTENIGIDEEDQSIIKVTSPVEYYAFASDGELIEISGSLELTFQSDMEKLNVENRIIISDANLVLDK